VILDFIKRLFRKPPRLEIFECVYGEDDRLLASGTYGFMKMPTKGEVFSRDGITYEVIESKFYPGMRTIVTVGRPRRPN